MSDLKCDLVTIKNLQLDCEAARRGVRVDMGVKQLRLLDCKICKDTPSPPVVLVTCCKQLLGCEACFRNCIEQSECCPLCRNPDTDSIVVEGLDAVYSYLKQSMEITDNHTQ